jgi:hypothetical protein
MTEETINRKDILKKYNHVVKTNKMFNAAVGHNYSIKFNTSTSTAVAIINNGVKKSSSLSSILRLDKAHGKTKFNHININHRISGVRDPHIRLPTGGLTVRMKKKYCLKYGFFFLTLTALFSIQYK